jgi:hypothetical protein
MNFARLDAQNVVVALVVSDERPNGCVPDDGTARIGAVYELGTFLAARFTSYEFLGRFTTAELDAILVASDSDAPTRRFLALAQAANEVISDDPVTVAGMEYLGSLGLLTSSRIDEILQR